MDNFNQKYNYSNVLIRSSIVGLIAELQKNLYYFQQLDNDTIEKVSVPVMYSITGSEQFLKDQFVYDALEQGKATGDYERSPRCVISLSNLSIMESEQTNKYVRARFEREVNGVLRTCSLMVNFIPVRLSFEATLICKTAIEQFKLTECIISKMYNLPSMFNLNLGPFVVQANYRCPADYNHERPTDFSMNDRKEYVIRFNIDMSSFLPVFEHGLLLCEIDEMLKELDNSKPGIVEFRYDASRNKMSMVLGGIIEEIVDRNHIGGDNSIKIIK